MSNENETESNVIPLFPDEMPPAVNEQGIELDEWVFTNDKNNPMLRQLFRMIYQTSMENKLGLMHAKVRGENKVHTILVGVQDTPEGTLTWPLAKILTEEEQGIYLAPDGVGGYIGEDTESDDAPASE